MDTAGLIYPFDPTGRAETNLVPNERQTLTSPGIDKFHYILPKAGPFFANDKFELVLFPGNDTLVEGVDYAFGHEFRSATRSTGIPVYGSIVFYDQTLAGSVRLTYQTVGGTWTISESKIAEILANYTIDPRITTWEQVTELPYAFPPTAHNWDIADSRRMDHVVQELSAMTQAIVDSNSGGAHPHFGNTSNPHNVTAQQIGLGSVINMGLATEQQAAQGTSNLGYMNPAMTAVAIRALAISVINQHLADNDNPHEVEKHHVGLSNVENYAKASREIAEQGLSDEHYLTPLSARWLIDIITEVYDHHLENINNPHGVTAAQTGAYDKTEIDTLLSNFLGADGVAKDSERVFGLDLNELLQQISTTPMENANTLQGLTVQDLATVILAGTASEAYKISGKSLADIELMIESSNFGSVNSYTVPGIGTVKSLTNPPPDPAPEDWVGIFDDVIVSESYTKIVGVSRELWGDEDAADVSFQLVGGRGLSSTAAASNVNVTVSFERLQNIEGMAVLKSVEALTHGSSPELELYYVVTETEVEFWVKDEVQRAPITVIDLTAGGISVFEEPFPEFLDDVVVTQPADSVHLLVKNPGQSGQAGVSDLIDLLGESVDEIDQLVLEINNL